jgi:proteic killer suppression protein
MAIQSFANESTEKFFITGKVASKVGWFNVRKIAKRKLDMLHFAAKISDLMRPPGNRLEALKGRMEGYYSIRVNDQWRVVFSWSEQGPIDVQVTDYH